MKNNNSIKPITVGAVFVILLAYLIYYSTQSTEHVHKEHSPALSSVEWILGTWENKKDSMVFQENWKVKDYNTFYGDGYLIKGNDTSFHENLTMMHLNGQILYITQFEGQNPTMFLLTSSEGNYLVFENKEHIYPSKISYNLINDSTMIAGLEGKNKFGEFVRREFRYFRTNQKSH